MSWRSGLREQFPILSTQVNGRPLVYLDNAATTQLPEAVLSAMVEQVRCHEGNVHRGIHALSERSTVRMEAARESLRRFLGSETAAQVVFTSGTTASINLVARALEEQLRPGDEILTTQMEHHANLIPWQELCRRSGALLRVAPVTKTGELDMEAFGALLSKKTRLAAVTWVSNVTGAVNPVRQMADMAHSAGAMLLVDGAQAVRHQRLALEDMGCDFFCLSGHKMMGPTGTGVLWGKRERLEGLHPAWFGGGMVDRVWDTGAAYGQLPLRLEAGTPNIVGNIGLGAAAEYLMALGRDNIAAWEQALLDEAVRRLRACPGVRFVGAPARRTGCVSFQLGDSHCYDVSRLLDQLGVAVRSGSHCAQPLLAAMGESGTVRVSPAFYNGYEDLDRFETALRRVAGVLTKG